MTSSLCPDTAREELARERAAREADRAAFERERAALRRERDGLMDLLAQRQRLAQAGLVTSALVHDVRNHVQVISGNAELVRSGPEDEEWARTSLDRIVERCRVVNDLMEAFLSFVRRREDVRSHFLASDAVELAGRLAGPLARENGVRLQCELRGDARIEGDSQLLVQSIVNLVSNAVQACGKGRSVRVALTRPEAATARVEVTDDAGGIPEEVRRVLFRPFATTHGDEGGNGIGLFVVRRSVRSLGGSVRVRSCPEGTTFVIDLPVRSD